MPYWRVFYHIIWTTKHRLPLITPEVEGVIFPAIAGKARDFNVIVYALNGVEDHVHLAAAIPPSVAASKVIGAIKGRSSRAVREYLNPDFAWQAGYGAQTFGEQQLKWVIAYIRGQKEHHAANRVHPRLETCHNEDDPPPRVYPD